MRQRKMNCVACREKERQIQAEGDQDRCTHILSATRIAREIQEPPPRPKQAKHNQKGMLK